MAAKHSISSSTENTTAGRRMPPTMNHDRGGDSGGDECARCSSSEHAAVHHHHALTHRLDAAGAPALGAMCIHAGKVTATRSESPAARRSPPRRPAWTTAMNVRRPLTPASTGRSKAGASQAGDREGEGCASRQHDHRRQDLSPDDRGTAHRPGLEQGQVRQVLAQVPAHHDRTEDTAKMAMTSRSNG